MKPIEILLVEDSPTDTLLAKEALKASKLQNMLHSVSDGEKALDFLHQRNGFEQSPRPDLILLDLNLPKKSGHEVLVAIKSDERFKSIPVIVLTTSNDEIDVLGAYREHANCYVVKPVDFSKFAEAVKAIDGFWFSVVQLPKS